MANNFNEGGADCPPKHSLVSVAAADRGTSMKGGRTAPRNLPRLEPTTIPEELQ